MKYTYLLISFLLIFCESSHSQIPNNVFTTLKPGNIRSGEFTKLDSLQLNTNLLRISRYTATFACARGSKQATDSICQTVSMVPVKGNSLRDTEFLKMFNKFSAPFIIVFEDIKVSDLENKQRTLMEFSIQIL